MRKHEKRPISDSRALDRDVDQLVKAYVQCINCFLTLRFGDKSLRGTAIVPHVGRPDPRDMPVALPYVDNTYPAQVLCLSSSSWESQSATYPYQFEGLKFTY